MGVKRVVPRRSGGELLLTKALPEFSEELFQLLSDASESKLAQQVESLCIVERCRCKDDFCSSFYTAQKPIGKYGTGHRTIELNPEAGMIILDLVDTHIMQVEVLYRPDVEGKLNLLFP
jgi:hypothetical protein